MASVEEKVNCVLWLAELKSLPAVQNRFTAHYNKDAPDEILITNWMKRFKETGCITDRMTPEKTGMFVELQRPDPLARRIVRGPVEI